MSWLSQHAGRAGGILAFPGPVGYIAGSEYDQKNNKQNPNMQGLQLSPAASARANQIIQEIQKNNTGSYGEGQISAAVGQFKKLKAEMESGKLSQSDYLAISGSVLPQVQQFGNQLGGGGSTTARAANAAGLQELNQLSAHSNVLKAGQQMLGRDLTPQEIAQATPIFSGPNGEQLGNAYLAHLSEVDAQNPNSAGNIAKAGKYGDSINGYFQSMLGRDATSDEKQHFGSLMATGNLDTYGMQQFLQGTPEYQNAQDKQFRTGLEGELQNVDTNFFNRAKQDVTSQFAQNGTMQSTALTSALTDLMGKMAEQRSGYLADLSAKQYGGNKDLAISNYQNTQNDYLNNRNANINRSYNQMDALMGRSNDIADYNTQKDDYTNFYNSQKPNQLMNYLNTGANLLNAGSNVYRNLK